MPKPVPVKCPTVSKDLVAWLEKSIPEPEFSGDALQMAFQAGRRDTVKALRRQYDIQQQKDPD